MEVLEQWLWRQEYWLPPGISWQDMHSGESIHRPQPRDLLFALPLALGFICLRHFFERSVALPLGRWLGVKDQVRIPPTPVLVLEAFYVGHGPQPSQTEVLSLAKQSNLPYRQVEMWFHRRRNMDRPSSTKKFCEACWRFSFYLVAFSAGLASLIHAPWFWDLSECWKGYPQQEVEPAHYWYYMLELGFYWSLLLCVSVDVKRKDFKEQVIHHIATIVLLGFSYCSNYVRVGTLVMLVHDSSDFLLESAKMLHYAGWRKTCDSLFVLFAAAFLLTRLVVFPSKVIHTTMVLSMEVFKPFFGYYFFNSLLLVLQMLHIFWAWLILRMVYKFLYSGKVDRDERSDEESEPGEDGDGEAEHAQWEKRKGTLNSRLTVLANNCVISKLTSQRCSTNSRVPKGR